MQMYKYKPGLSLSGAILLPECEYCTINIANPVNKTSSNDCYTLDFIMGQLGTGKLTRWTRKYLWTQYYFGRMFIKFNISFEVHEMLFSQ